MSRPSAAAARSDRLLEHHRRAAGELVPWRCREDRPERGGPCTEDGVVDVAAGGDPWEAWRAHWLAEHHRPATPARSRR